MVIEKAHQKSPALRAFDLNYNYLCIKKWGALSLEKSWGILAIFAISKRRTKTSSLRSVSGMSFNSCRC